MYDWLLSMYDTRVTLWPLVDAVTQIEDTSDLNASRALEEWASGSSLHG
jgi:hypothetical protein